MYKAIGKTTQGNINSYQIQNMGNTSDIVVIPEADLKFLLAFGYEINGADNNPLKIGPRGGIYGDIPNGIKTIKKEVPKVDNVSAEVDSEEEFDDDILGIIDDYPQAEPTGIEKDDYKIYLLEPDTKLYVIYDKNLDDFVTDEDGETLYIFSSGPEAIDYAQQNLIKKEETNKINPDLHIKDEDTIAADDTDDERKISQLYEYLTFEQEQLLQQYYMWFSRRHFETSYKDPLSKRLATNTNARGKKKLEAKKEQLDAIKKQHSTNGVEHTMVYGGYIDNHKVKHHIYDPNHKIDGEHYALNGNGGMIKGKEAKEIPESEKVWVADEDRNAYCSIGHAIRFMHIAWDVNVAGDPDNALFNNHALIRDGVRMDKKLKQAEQEGKCIIFGCSIGDKGACLGDFFGVDSVVTDALHAAQMAALKDMEILLDIYKSGNVSKVIQSFKLMDDFIAMTKPKDLRNTMVLGKDYEKIVSTKYVIDNRLCEFYTAFRNLDMIPPKTLVQEIRQSMLGWTSNKFTYAIDRRRLQYFNIGDKKVHLSYPKKFDFFMQLVKLYGNYVDAAEYANELRGIIKTEQNYENHRFIYDAEFKSEINKLIAIVTNCYLVTEVSSTNNVSISLNYRKNKYMSPIILAIYLYLVDLFCYKITGYYEYDADKNKDEGGSSRAAATELNELRYLGKHYLGNNIDYDLKLIPDLLEVVKKEVALLDLINSKQESKGALLPTLIMNRFGDYKDFIMDNKLSETLSDFRYKGSYRMYMPTLSVYFSDYRKPLNKDIDTILHEIDELINIVSDIYQKYDNYSLLKEQKEAEKKARIEEALKEADAIYTEFKTLDNIIRPSEEFLNIILPREDSFDTLKHNNVSYPLAFDSAKISKFVNKASKIDAEYNALRRNAEYGATVDISVLKKHYEELKTLLSDELSSIVYVM